MPTVEKHLTGAFCWIELGTTDQSAAKAFYTSLLGWTVNDFPMGPTETYTMFQLGEQTAAAAYTMRPEEAKHIPPHWSVYIAVASADETAKRVPELGGKIVEGPFDVQTHGRMAVVQDPTGAYFAIWEPKTHKGIGVKDEPGSLCWVDLHTLDPKRAEAFYTALFGWVIEPGQDDSGYLHIKNGENYIGGIAGAEHNDPNVPPHWLTYLQVADCDASTSRAKELGARVYMGPMSMQNVGRMSVLADPQGAVFSLFEHTRQ